MPIPDGKTYIQGDWNADQSTVDDATSYLEGNYEEEFERDYFEAYVSLLNEVKKKGSIPANISYDLLVEGITDFFMNVPKDRTRLQEAAKNVAIQAAFDINNAVVNIMSAQRPVDMDAPRSAADRSDKQWNAKQLTLDNYMTIPMMIDENNQGKSDVGIFAATMKVFYAISHIQNQAVKREESYFRDEFDINQDWFDFKQQIEHRLGFKPRAYVFYENGKPIIQVTNLTANINFDNSPHAEQTYERYLEETRKYYQDPENVKKFMEDKGLKYDPNVTVNVIDVRNIDDTATTVLSALISAATDFFIKQVKVFTHT